ncbi:MAG: DMT family transporter, partial [Myxococcota bacterium]
MNKELSFRSAPLDGGFAADDDEFAFVDWGLFAGLACVWGSSFLLIALGLEAMPPGVVTLARVGLGALVLALFPRPAVRFEAADRNKMLLMSLLWVAIPFTLFPIAEQYVNSAVAGLLNGATPIVAALVAAIFLGRSPNKMQWMGIVVGFFGIVMISAPSLSEGTNEATGVVMVLLATVCYGVSVHMAPPLQAKYGSVNVMARMLAWATLWSMPWGLAGLPYVRFEWIPWLSVLVLGTVGTGLAFVMMAQLIKRVGSTRASLITYLLPIVALVLGVMINNDRVAPIALGGVVFTLAGA